MTDEEIETARALGLLIRKGAEDGTLEDIAWREAYKIVPINKLSSEVNLSSMRGAFYEGFIAGFTHKFTGEIDETN